MALEYEEIDLGRVDGIDGTDGREIEIRATPTHIEEHYKGETTWRAIIALASLIGPQGIQGPAGKKLMVQKTSTHLQYKYEGETTWTNWVALSDITGPIGLPGPKGEAGSQLLYYAGVPTTAIGVKGDTCIDTSSKDWDVYYKSTDTKWDKKGYLKGQAGGLGGDTVPIGTFMSFTGTTVQDGWLPCDGRAVSRTDYAALFAVIGTSYGVGNGTTTFNIPNEPNPVSYRTEENGGTRLITHEPALKVIIKAKQVVPVVASIEDNLTSDSKTNGLSAAQGKALKEMVDNVNPNMRILGEKDLYIFAYDGTTRYYAGTYARREGHVDIVGDRLFIDFNVKVSALGDISKAPNTALIYIQILNIPKYITNQFSPIGMYNIALSTPYNQLGITMTIVEGNVCMQVNRFSDSGYSGLTRGELSNSSALIGGTNYRRASS